MNEEQPVFARSEAGHDKGSWFFVLDRQGAYLLLADGKNRKISAPKRKKWKHVSFTGGGAPAAARSLCGEPVTDKGLRRALAAWRAACE